MATELNTNDDFKYVMQDTSHVYFGKELTYEEMMEHNDIPFKFKAIISTFVSKDVPLQKKMVDHLLYMDTSSFTYQVYNHIKMEVKIFYKEEKVIFGKKTKEHWVHKTCTLASFVEKYRASVIAGEVVIEDISISKLALMMLSL